LQFITDSSNSSDLHRRNRLRNTILPALDAAFPGAVDAILRTVANLESTAAIYSEAVETKRKTYLDGDSRLRLLELVQSEPEARTLLFEFLRPLSFTYTQVCDMADGASRSGATFMSADGRTVAEISHGILDISDASRLHVADRDTFEVSLRHDIAEPVHIAVSRHDIAEFRPGPLGARTAFFDASVLDEPHRWQFRHYRRGDRMVPFGSVKSKLVSDLFAGARYSASQKRAAWLLTCDDEPVWIPGLRNSARFALGPCTKQYIRLEIID
ncbi:MAG: hypothetical protein K2J38_06305, partial [Muribaculaceae bacterium]|nr:hypothetical protein [Muribaculaceae bacterium]